MNFWENVVEELKYQGKTRKWLANECNFDESTLASGLKRKCIPNAELALKIAHTLNVTLDYLLDLQTSKESNESTIQIDLKLCKKYYRTIKKLDSLSECTRFPICKMIEDIV